MMKFRKHFERDQEIITVFKYVHEGPFRVNPDGVQYVKFFSPSEIKRMLDRGRDSLLGRGLR